MASRAPVEAPDGTAARPMAPDSSNTSHSTVGLPRESRISRPMISTIALMVLIFLPERLALAAAAAMCPASDRKKLIVLFKSKSPTSLFQALAQIFKRDLQDRTKKKQGWVGKGCVYK